MNHIYWGKVTDAGIRDGKDGHRKHGSEKIVDESSFFWRFKRWFLKEIKMQWSIQPWLKMHGKCCEIRKINCLTRFL